MAGPILGYDRFAQSCYRKNGEPVTEVESIRVSVRSLRELFGTILANEFGSLELEAVRDALIASGLSGNEVNRRVG